MKLSINIVLLCTFFFFSCTKESIKNDLIGEWKVESTYTKTFSDGQEFVTESEFNLSLREDGTGMLGSASGSPSSMFWTISPDNGRVFISNNYHSDSFSIVEVYDVISVKKDKMIWENEEVVSGNRFFKRWNLNK
jgi:hypothetical protein